MRFFCAVILFFTCAIAYCDIDKNKVFVVANNKKAESISLAKKYAQMREIPENNIICADFPTKETITKDDYENLFLKPLLSELEKKGAVKFIEENPTPLSFDIDFLVLCKGIPLKIQAEKTEKKSYSPSIDSVLSSTFLQKKEKTSALKNPLYENANPNLFKSFGVLRIARIDGHSYEDVHTYLDNTIYAEMHGTRGRAYIDKSYYVLKKNTILDEAEQILTDLGYDISVNTSNGLFSFHERFDSPVFYFGWYADTPKQYAKDDFPLAKGAIAAHIYSYSADTLANLRRWCPKLLSKGACATIGNVDEPFLALSHNFDKFMKALSLGFSAGEASYYSTRVLHWQTIFIGDPLYKPFKYSFENQLADLEKSQDNLSQYVVIRKMNLLFKEGSIEKAIAFGEKHVDTLPLAPALLWKLSELYQKSNNQKSAIDYAVKAGVAASGNLDYDGLIFEISKFLSNNLDNTAYPIRFCEAIIERRFADEAFLRSILPIAKDYAQKANNHSLAKKYSEKLNEFARIDAEAKPAKQKEDEAKKSK